MRSEKIGLSHLLFITVLVFVISPMVNAIVLSRLWSMFIVNEFHLRPLSPVHALGVCIVVRVMTAGYTWTPTNPASPNNGNGYTKAQVVELTGVTVLTPLVLLLIGYIVHSMY